MKTTKKLIIIALFLSPFVGNAQMKEIVSDAAQQDTAKAVEAKQKNDLSTRETLTNQWGGLAPKMKKVGVTVKASYTSFEQGMLSGQNKGDKEWLYGSKLMATVLINTSKLLNWKWKGLFLVGRFDYNMGHSVDGYGGTLLPVNTAMAYPGELGGTRVGSSAYLIQFLSPTQKIFVGKLSMLDLSAFSDVKGGEGGKTFQNVAFLTSPNGLTTPSVFGGFFVSESKTFDYSVALYGAGNALNNWNVYQSFENGLTAYASADLPIKIAGLSGKQGLFGVYSTKESRSLSEIPNNIDFNNLPSIPSVRGYRYSYGYYFSQNLYQSSTNKKKVITLFGQAVITDKKTTPMDWGLLAGVGGSSPFRTVDRWGIAGYKYSLLNNLEGIPTTIFYPGRLQSSESGVEVFYDCQLLPWISLGADFQCIKPGSEPGTATFLGLRSRIKL